MDEQMKPMKPVVWKPKARAADEESYSYEDEDWVYAKSGCRSATSLRPWDFTAKKRSLGMLIDSTSVWYKHLFRIDKGFV